MIGDAADEVSLLMLEAKRIARRYYEITGRPLGIIGEIAEHEAVRILGLEIAPVREAAIDAFQKVGNATLSYQIKGRAVDPQKKYRGRVSRLKLLPAFDAALLVLLDKTTYEPIEIWQADYAAVAARLNAPGSKSRNERGSMDISQFKSIARRIWERE
jgi:hypothetical protein